MAKPKQYHESFARFFESPTREGFRDLIKMSPGEMRTCDFKEQWHEHSGLSKHILGLANSGSGCLVMGVREADDGTMSSTGLAQLKDKADVTNGIKNYLPSSLLSLVETVDFAFEASEYPLLVGKRFQVVFVNNDPAHIPFVSTRSGSGIRQNASTCGARA